MFTSSSVSSAAALVFAVFVAGDVAAAQIASAFESARFVPLPSGVAESLAADLDGDGDQDYVAALANANQLVVLRNRGDGTFAPPHLVAAAIYPHHLQCADFDGDGDLDVFALDEDSTAARVYVNPGDGTLAPSVGYAAGYHPWTAAVADYDGDGRPDVALVTQPAYGSPVELRILWNDGQGALGTSTTIQPASAPSDLRSADLDGDGDVDLAMLENGRLVALRNRGDGTFETGPSIDLGANVYQYRLDDHDRDGDVDLMFVQSHGVQPATMSVARNLGDGTFAAPALVTSIDIDTQIEVADFDGDQRADLLGYDPSSDELRLWRGRGDATFEAPRAYALDATVFPVTAIDLEDDGDLDVVCGGTNGIVVVENHGAGRFDDEERNSGSDEVVEGADLDGDGDLDLVTHGSSSIGVLENLGNGVYGPLFQLPSSNNSDDARLADIDGDGDVDIVRVSKFGQGLLLWRNQGDGTFTAPAPITFAGYPSRFATGDVDADGDVDVVVAFADEWWSEFQVLVLRNRGDGTFERGDHFETDRLGTRAELADFDGDGDMDLALASEGAPNLMWLRNDGSGRFDAAHPQPFPTYSPRLVDFDADGHLDVLTNSWPDALLYSRNRGDGTFEPARTLVTGASIDAESLSVIDVDEDGDLDLTNGYVLLENTGHEDVVLVGKLNSSNLGPPLVGDVDSDGDDDLVLARRTRVIRNGFQSGVAIALGDGSGAPCPCGNSGASGRGCANSIDAQGGQLRASGNARLANDTLVLHASGMTHGPALWLQGSQSANGGLGAPFGDGLLGVAGTIVRLAATGASTGAASYPVGNARTIHTLGGVGAPGTRTYQVLYRDVASHCMPSAFNLTNALVVSWIP